MKQKNLFKIALCFLLISTLSYGQDWTEDFETQTSGSYGTSSITINGRDWTRNFAGNFGYPTTKGISRGFTINDDKPNAHITTPVLNTCGTVSFKYAYINGSSANVFLLQISTDGTNFSTLDTHTLGASANENYINYSYDVNNLSSTVFIRILSDDQNAHLVIDDFSVTSYSTTAAGISLGSVSGNTNESGTTATFTAVLLNVAPTTDVVLNISSSDNGEVTISPSTLTFTNGDWDTPQTITATGIDDAIEDGDINVIITASVVDASSDDTYDSVDDVTTTVTNEDDDLPQIMISEIMYNTPSTDDEWIEIYNGNGSDVDISGWMLAYNGKTFTFPASTTITNGDYLTIAVGSNGDGTYNNDSPFTPDFHNLSGATSNADVKTTNDSNNLGNTSGTITLQNSSESTIDTVNYNKSDDSDTNGKGPSFEIEETILDNSVTSANWRPSVADGGSPGRISSTVWSGATDTDWNKASNWIYDNIPVATQDVAIPKDLTNYPIASNAVTVNSVTILSGASLIAQSTFSGTIICNRRVQKNQWHLVSSPVTGETYDDAYVAANLLAVNGSNNAISNYVSANDSWSYMQTGDAAANFNAGQGYSMRRVTDQSAGNISFTGTLNTENVETSSLAVGFNLLGNPYTSFVNSATFLGATTSSNLDQSQIWLWNGATGMYEVKTSGDAWVLAPGQGFFVNATSAGTVTFDESNQAATGDSFKKSEKTEVKLLLSDGENNRFAKLNFGDNFNKGYDYGWEGETFGGIPNSLSIFTSLVNDNAGKRYQVQSLPNSDYESMIVPVGITADAGKEITFSTETMNLPEGIKVFLEDRSNNTFTRLDEANATHKITLEDALDGVGRFYVHTTQSALSIDTIALNSVSIFKANATTLRVTGLQQGKASLSLFNVLGKQVMSTSFDASASKDIFLPKLAKGIYFAQVQTAAGKLSKKIIIE
jgi:hypothetical protein